VKQPYELSIALRYLRARSRYGFISFISAVSMIGIGLAVAVLIVVLSVMNGFEHEMQERILGMVADATIAGYEGPLEDWRALRERALAHGAVEAAAPYVEGQSMVMAMETETSAGVTVRGVDPALEREVSTIEEVMRQGRVEALVPGENNILIGRSLAELLEVGVGAELVLVRPEARITPVGLFPTMRSFTVAGIFEAGMYDYDRGLVFVNFEDATRLFRTRGRATGLRLDVTSLYAAGEVATELASELADELGRNFYVSDWTRQHAIFFRSIQLQKSIMFVILSLVIAVAAFNIVSTLMMVVRDKRGDIAILRSFGAAPRAIMTIFASQGTLIGLAGTLFGVVLAVLIVSQLGAFMELIEAWFDIDLLSEEVYFLNQLPTQLRPLEIVQICLLALGLAVAATLYPALSAARQAPAEALRYE
jgi:lipoprotein-releasing system permease protein